MNSTPLARIPYGLGIPLCSASERGLIPPFAYGHARVMHDTLVVRPWGKVKTPSEASENLVGVRQRFLCRILIRTIVFT